MLNNFKFATGTMSKFHDLFSSVCTFLKGKRTFLLAIMFTNAVFLSLDTAPTIPLYTQSQFQTPENNAQYLAQGDDAMAANSKAADNTVSKLDVKRTTGPVINFNNVSIVEFLRFVSRLTGKNFIFDPDELQFSVTIISESAASIEDIMAALLQNLRIHDFELLEQGPSFLIHRNKEIRSPSELYREGEELIQEPQLATRVFLVKYADIDRAGAIIKTMTSPDAIVEILSETRRIVVTDIVTNIKKIGELIASFDSPSSGVEIGQYVIQNTTPDVVIGIAQQIMEPIVGGQTFTLVPHLASNSIYVISTPFFVEKALSVIQSIDANENVTRVFSFDKLQFNAVEAQKHAENIRRQQKIEDERTGFNDDEINQLSDTQIQDVLTERGYTPDQIRRMSETEIRQLLKDRLGPKAQKIRMEIRRKRLFETNLPLGQVESTKFLIQKLQYRKCAEVAHALKSIAQSIRSGTQLSTGQSDANSPQTDLIITLNSISTLEENNSLVFSGTSQTLAKVKELILQVDIPVRQVFIEALVLDTTIQNALNFGVEWGAKLQRHNAAVQLGFVDVNSNVPSALNEVTATSPNPMNPLPLETGFSAGSIGRRIKFNGTGFVSLAALINALRADTETNIIMNPKITTEHNVPAEVFVGAQIGIKGQSVSNNNGNILTTNFETRATGITLKVTPLISAYENVTLILEQKISSANSVQVAAQGQANAPPATINETRTTTRVHLPSGYFLVISGMINEQKTKTKNQIPCLGALPFLGNLFANSSDTNNNRNLMIFIRPVIIDTEIDIEEITKKEQQIFEDKSGPIDQSRTPLDDFKEIINF